MIFYFDITNLNYWWAFYYFICSVIAMMCIAFSANEFDIYSKTCIRYKLFQIVKLISVSTCAVYGIYLSLSCFMIPKICLNNALEDIRECAGFYALNKFSNPNIYPFFFTMLICCALTTIMDKFIRKRHKPKKEIP